MLKIEYKKPLKDRFYGIFHLVPQKKQKEKKLKWNEMKKTDQANWRIKQLWLIYNNNN